MSIIRTHSLRLLIAPYRSIRLRFCPTRSIVCSRTMKQDGKSYLSHEERTAASARDSRLHEVVLSRIEQVNKNTRVLRLTPKNRIEPPKFLPGQWLDVHVPGLTKAGGFTITSTPSKSRVQDAEPYLELAVQFAPNNPPAAYLWKPEQEILGRHLTVRIGGDFVFPPRDLPAGSFSRVLLVAGGVGINPLISILTHLVETDTPLQSIKLLYATKSYSADRSDILFLPRINDLLNKTSSRLGGIRVELYITNTYATEASSAIKSNIDSRISTYSRRISKFDLEKASETDHQMRRSTLCYVCGPQTMTDEFVNILKEMPGMSPANVLCEKWW